MPDPVNLNLPGAIAAAIDGAALEATRWHWPVSAVTAARRSLSGGSAYVRGSTELAFWSRTRDSRLAAEITDRPRVSLAFFETDGPGARYLAIEGRARVAPELDDEVYAAISEPERQHDPERKGVAVIVEVDSVVGASADGLFRQGSG